MAAKKSATKKAASKKRATKKAAAARPAMGARADKGDGQRVVDAWIAKAKPQHRAVAKWVDEVVSDEIPNAKKAVKWGALFWGVEGQGWIATFASFKAYTSVGFFAGTKLKPVPPVGESGFMRRVNIPEGTEPDEKQLRAWLKQAAKLPGWGTV